MKKKITSCICMMVLAFMALAGTVQAADRAGAFYLSPFVGGYVFDDDDQAHLRQNRPMYGLRLGFDFTDHFAAELVGHYINGELKGSDRNLDIYSYRLDLLYNFMPRAAFVPYVAIGGGGTTIRVSHGPNSHDGTAAAGLGFKYFWNPDMAFRGDMRHVVDFQDSHLHRNYANNWEYSAGLVFLFGGREAAAEPAMAAKPAAEPVREPVAKEPAAKAEPRPEPVPAYEPTPGHYKYCVTLQGEFDIDKALIRPELKQEIEKVGNFMKKYPTTTAVIEGHTDNVGSYNHNMDLSQRRAEAVVDHLVEQYGIDRSRLVAKGYGFTRPIADNSSEVGKQKNRRIEAIVDCAFDVQEVTPPERLCMSLVIDFDEGKSDVKPQYRNEIAKVADYMQRYKTTTAIIEGHTDKVGSPEANMKLSQQRAQGVVDYLVNNFGIERSRLFPKGYGETRPVSYNNTPEGRQKNRRINAVIDCVVK